MKVCGYVTSVMKQYGAQPTTTLTSIRMEGAGQDQAAQNRSRTDESGHGMVGFGVMEISQQESSIRVCTCSHPPATVIAECHVLSGECVWKGQIALIQRQDLYIDTRLELHDIHQMLGKYIPHPCHLSFALFTRMDTILNESG